MKQYIYVFIGSFLCVSCNYFKPQRVDNPIARVNDTYLYIEDVEGLFSAGKTPDDSVQLITNYINEWATQQLLIDRAKVNLPESTIAEYDKLVAQYKIDLYTEAYKRAIVAQQFDSVVSNQEMKQYYKAYKENFKLNGDLLQFRYICVRKDYDNLEALKVAFKNFDEADQESLTAASMQFKSYYLNDSVWIKKSNVLNILPVLATASTQVLKKSNFTQLEDSLGVYLVKVENTIDKNEIAPLQYIAPTIEQILLSKRNLELIKKLETDITKDAIRNKKFEIYPQK